MRIAVIGTGYVGITTIAFFGELGYPVIGVDIDKSKIGQLNKGILPAYEPGVEPVIQTLLEQGLIRFTTSIQEAVSESEILLIAVGTPSLPDGRPNLKDVEDVAFEIGRHIAAYRVIVNKSTVPVGTADRMRSIITKQIQIRGVDAAFDIVSNPEFFQEGRALHGARNPDRIILGCSSPLAEEIMLRLYQKVDAPKQITNPRDAEMIKYASNGFLAAKITYINEIARLCDRLGVDVMEVAKGMGADERIGEHFLQAGIGYGGSCFPKDISALIAMGREVKTEMKLLQSVQEVNHTQTEWFVERLKQQLGGLADRRIALLGLAFKPETDDIREAPSLRLSRILLDEGAVATGYDPVANSNMKKMNLNIQIKDDAYDAAEGADALVICTEWKEFATLNWRRMKSLMKGNIIFDGRNALDRNMLMLEGFHYVGVGR